MRKQTLIKKGKDLLNKITTHQNKVHGYNLQLAKLAYENCISGAYIGRYKQKEEYTYSNFARDIGVCRFVLCNEIKTYRDVCLKGNLDVYNLAAGDYSKIYRVRRRIKASATKSEVKSILKEEDNKSSQMKYLENAYENLRRLNSRVETAKFNRKEKAIIRKTQEEACRLMVF